MAEQEERDIPFAEFEETKGNIVSCGTPNNYRYYNIVANKVNYIYKKYPTTSYHEGVKIKNCFEKFKKEDWFQDCFGRIYKINDEKDKAIHILQADIGTPISYAKQVLQSIKSKTSFIFSLIKRICGVIKKNNLYTSLITGDTVFYNPANALHKITLHVLVDNKPIESYSTQGAFECPPEVDADADCKLYKDNKSVIYSIGMLAVSIALDSMDDITNLQANLADDKLRNFLMTHSIFKINGDFEKRMFSLLLSMLDKNPESRISLENIMAELEKMLTYSEETETVQSNSNISKNYSEIYNAYGNIKSVRIYKPNIERVDFEKISLLFKIYSNKENMEKEKAIMEKLFVKSNYVKEHMCRIVQCEPEKCRIAMEYGGKCLSEYMKNIPFDIKRILLIIEVLITVIKFLQEAKLFHGDLKPENLSICEQDGKQIVKIFDYDISQLLDSLDAGTTIKGIGGYTHDYAPMECFLPDENVYFPQKIDIFSLGKIAIALFKNIYKRQELNKFLYNQEFKNNEKQIEMLTTTQIVMNCIDDLISVNDYNIPEKTETMSKFIRLIKEMLGSTPQSRPAFDDVLSKLLVIKEEFIAQPKKVVVLNSQAVALPRKVECVYIGKFTALRLLGNVDQNDTAATISKFTFTDSELKFKEKLEIKIPTYAIFYNYVNGQETTILYIIGGVESQNIASNKVSYFYDNKLYNTGNLMDARLDCGITSYGQYIYCCGGQKKLNCWNDYVNTIEQYDTVTNKSIQKQCMKQPKYGCTICPVSSNNGVFLYMFGGKLDPVGDISYDTNEEGVCLDYSTLIEVYNPNTLEIKEVIDTKSLISANEFKSAFFCSSAQVSNNEILLYGKQNLRLDEQVQGVGNKKVVSTLGTAYIYNFSEKKFVKLAKEERDEISFETSSIINAENELILFPKFQEIIEGKETAVIKYLKQSRAFDYLFLMGTA